MILGGRPPGKAGRCRFYKRDQFLLVSFSVSSRFLAGEAGEPLHKTCRNLQRKALPVGMSGANDAGFVKSRPVGLLF